MPDNEIDDSTLTTAGLASVLGVADDRARQLADQHDLVIGRDTYGRRIISASRARALAIARAARAMSRSDDRVRERARRAIAEQSSTRADETRGEATDLSE